MAGADVKVIGAWLSPYVMRPRIALNIKGVGYEFLEQAFGTKSELLLKSNPVYKKIPVLLHGDRAICESMIIVEYIDRVWATAGPAILSTDPYDHALARFWAVYLDDKWFPSLTAIAKAETDGEKAAAIEQLHAATQLLEGAFGKCSKGRSFFGGDNIGYLDIAFGSFLGWLRATEEMTGMEFLDKDKTPHLFRWADSFCAEKAVEGVMPETDKLVEFAKVLQTKWKAAAAAPPAN